MKDLGVKEKKGVFKVGTKQLYKSPGAKKSQTDDPHQIVIKTVYRPM